MLLGLAAGHAAADSPPPHPRPRPGGVAEAGATRCEAHPPGGAHPLGRLACTVNGEAGFSASGGAEQLLLSADGTFLVALSNLQHDRHPFVVARAARTLVARRFRQGPTTVGAGALPVCRRSASVGEEWYDAADPAVRFVLGEHGELEDVRVRGCDGQPLSLRSLAPFTGGRDPGPARTGRGGTPAAGKP